MEPRYRFRLYLLTALILLGIWTLLHRLHQFQIEDQQYFLAQKPSIHTVAIREPGVRGEIVDRNGVPLATNQRKYRLAVNLGEVQQSWKEQRSADLSNGDLQEPPKKKSIDEILEEWILPRLAKQGFSPRLKRTDVKVHFGTHTDMVPYVFAEELDFETFSRLAERNPDLPGVYVNSEPQRSYPLGSLACHILGYVQQWKKGTQTEAEKQEYDHYFGDSQGMEGVEKALNEELTGEPGKRSLYKDEKNNVLGIALDTHPPGVGAKVTLALDAGVQCLVENVLRQAGRAAAVVMDVNTGEVLAMASVPNYDPNDYVPGMSTQVRKEYLSNKAQPFLNRSVTDFQSGSTTKIPVALTALVNDECHFHDNCRGYVTYGRTKIRCHRTSGHGGLGLERAIQVSCNPYFMNLANRVGWRDMVAGFNDLYLGRRTGVGLPEEMPGVLPGNTLWLQQQEPGAFITNAQMALISIGQWDMRATPLQICAITATVANGGKYYRPRVVKEVVSSEGVVLIADEPELRLDLVEDKGVSSSDITRLQKGMWMAVNQIGGTATNIAIADFPIAAKTGTVQVRKEPKVNNAWTTAFGPYDSPRYAVTVFVEGGASGGKVAGPLVHMIMRGLAASEKGLKLPVKRMGNFAGHFDRIEAIELPEDSLLSIPLEEDGETGDEVSDVLDESEPVMVKPRVIPLPGGGGGPSGDQE
ncbi:MAG: penicillin-binding transpeptidase domain-containing protein [Verrucomicrobiota bacterium JB023]|nr:penicillin-binding transpeptidase domain-containing protein [Verrucomicrobiota bacterium JB023]